MIWKIRAIEARPVEGNEDEYEFDADIEYPHGYMQVLDFTPEMEILNEVFPPVVVIAYPDRDNSELSGCGSSSENELTNRSE